MSAPLKLLALVLAVLQARPCSECAIYLCWAQDGSLCVDAGPDHCTCAETSHDHADTACCGDGHDDEPNFSVIEPPKQPCGCIHVPLSQQRPTVLVARAPNTVRNAAFDRAAGDAPPVHCALPIGTGFFGDSPPGSAPASARPVASTPLRC